MNQRGSREQRRPGGRPAGDKGRVHPNDDVNMSQSSNDVFPAVMHIATVEELENVLIPAVQTLRDTLDAKARQYHDLVMIGRTHLQDAKPLTLGQAISGWVAQLTSEEACVALGACRLALGGPRVAPDERHPLSAMWWRENRDRRKPCLGAKSSGALAHDAMAPPAPVLRPLARPHEDRHESAGRLGTARGAGDLRIPENEPAPSIPRQIIPPGGGSHDGGRAGLRHARRWRWPARRGTSISTSTIGELPKSSSRLRFSPTPCSRSASTAPAASSRARAPASTWTTRFLFTAPRPIATEGARRARRDRDGTSRRERR